MDNQHFITGREDKMKRVRMFFANLFKVDDFPEYYNEKCFVCNEGDDACKDCEYKKIVVRKK